MSHIDNKRIAKNTAFLYARMLIVMAISIFTVRIVLENLGIVDYGIYNVVGGLSSCFIFFHTALTNATQRFLNFELGKNNFVRLSRIFNISLELYAVIAIAVIIVGCIGGTWFVLNKLSIPPGKETAACITLYATLAGISFIFISAVYEAVLISRENMKVYAYTGLFDAFAKLAVAYAIAVIPFDKLISYSILFTVFSIAPKAFMIYYCRKHYGESEIKPYWDKNLFKEIFSFSGWNFYGTAVWMVNQQGINIILNIFCGPVINAARGIAYQVTNVVTNFCTNFFTAVKPQIIKSYAVGDFTGLYNLILRSSRYSVYLIWIFFLPIYLRIDYVLHLWLTEVPDYTSLFVKWVLVYMVFETLNNPVWTAIQAVGKIKTTMVYSSTVFLLAFPLSYLCLRQGLAPWTVYPSLIVMRIAANAISLYMLRQYTGISLRQYARSVILPVILVTFVTMVIMYPIDSLFAQNFISLLIVSLLSLMVNAMIIGSVGIPRHELTVILSQISNVVKKITGKSKA